MTSEQEGLAAGMEEVYSERILKHLNVQLCDSEFPSTVDEKHVVIFMKVRRLCSLSVSNAHTLGLR